MRSVIVMLLAALTALALAACGSGQSSQAQALFGPFASYEEYGAPTRVAGTITVPRILAGSPAGRAGSWIGAEGPTSGAGSTRFVNNGPFVQIGVNEERKPGFDGRLANFYYVFYSSLGMGFHPKTLLLVAPGDRIALTMDLRQGTWTLSADNLTQAATRHATVRTGNAEFNLALWTQEDISDTATGGLFPYPTLGTTRFGGLSVNGRAPGSSDLEPTWMTEQGGILGPSPLSGDGFGIVAEHPSAAGLAYARAATQLSEPDALFSARLARWSSATPRAEIRSACDAFAQVLTANIHAFQVQRWPANVAGPIRQLEAFQQQHRRLVLAVGASSPADFAAARETEENEDDTNLVNEIHSRLGIPRADLGNIQVTKYFASHGS